MDIIQVITRELNVEKWQSMKRQVITIQEDMVIYAPHHGEVWMTVWEIAELKLVYLLMQWLILEKTSLSKWKSS